MRDYLEELLEELAEETEGRERPQSALLTAEPLAAMPLYGYGVPPAGAALLARGARGTGENPTTGGAGSPGGELPLRGKRDHPGVPLSGEARGAKTEGAFYDESHRKNPPVSFADSPLGKGAKGGAVEALRSRLRRGTLAAAYRANTPYLASADVAFPSRERQGLAVSELDAAVRRDARRYDGEMTLY